MSLSLVDYRSSSDSEDDDQPQQLQRQPGKQHTATGTRSGISQLLPPPQNNKAPTKKSIFYLPSAVSDEDEDEKPSKRLKHGATSSNLADLLPAPKNNLNPFRKPTTTTATITPTTPSQSTRSADKTPLATHSSQQKDDDDNNNNNNNSESDNDQDDIDEQQESTKTTPSSKFTGSFFHIGSKLKDMPINKPAKVASSSLKHSISNDDQQIQQQQLQPTYQEQQQQQQPPILEDPNAMYAFGADPNAYYQYYYQQQQQQEEDASNKEMLDYNALSQLGGKRRGENAGVNIIDVNQTDILPSEEWRRQAEAQQPKFPLTTTPATFDVNSAKKKNNNIMALAAQAKSMESALEERYAQQRMAKNQARNRYGF